MEDLKEMGIQSVGIRKRILAAILALSAPPPDAAAADAVLKLAAASSSPPPTEAETEPLASEPHSLGW